jgi:hypothetical protein
MLRKIIFYFYIVISVLGMLVFARLAEDIVEGRIKGLLMSPELHASTTTEALVLAILMGIMCVFTFALNLWFYLDNKKTQNNGY